MVRKAEGLSEFEIIARFFRPLAAAEPGAFGLTDDAAVVSLKRGRELVITTDTIVAGIHFLPSDPPRTVASKLLSVNLSDLAAMGAEPFAYTLSAALPRDWTPAEREEWLSEFSQGLAVEQAAIGVSLIGGDTVAIPGPVCLTVTAFGSVRKGAQLRRSGAKPGDIVFVSGTIGDAALGLMARKGELPGLGSKDRCALEDHYCRPRARLELGKRLAGLAHSAVDISDGLIADLDHVCVASGCTADIELRQIPLSDVVRRTIASDPTLLRLALTGGDDYELIFTAAPEAESLIRAISKEMKLPIAAIGRVLDRSLSSDDNRVRVIDVDGSRFDFGAGGYRHFVSSGSDCNAQY